MAGLLAALTLAGNRLGLNALLVALALALAVLLSGRRPRGLWPGVLGVLALALASMALIRAAVWVVVPCLLAAAALASLAVAGGSSWSGVVRGLTGAFAKLPDGPRLVRRAGEAGIPSGSGRAAAPVLRGIGLAAALLAIFGALFASGDRAFGELAEGLLPSGLDLESLPLRIVWFVLVAGFAGGLVAASGIGLGATAVGAPARRLGRTEWAIALGALDLLFVFFVAVQAAVLFGHDEHVLRTAGLTYAEYAREGFGQLLVAAALTLAVTAGALRFASARGRGERIVLRALLVLLCALTLVVLASAFHRLDLYQDAFGATRPRLAAEATALWVAALIAVVVGGLALGRYGWLPRASVLLSAVGLLAFSGSNPDRRIAERNVDRFERSGSLDSDYLRGLSADAVPALTTLPPVPRGYSLRRQERLLAGGDGLAELNLARRRARSSLGL